MAGGWRLVSADMQKKACNMYYNSDRFVKHRLSPNLPPPWWIAPHLTKRAVLSAYSWHLVSASSAQHVINRFRLWSA